MSDKRQRFQGEHIPPFSEEPKTLNQHRGKTKNRYLDLRTGYWLSALLRRTFLSQNQTADAMSENFADLLAESFAEDTSIEGSVVKGIVVGVSDDHVTIDVGLK